METFHAHFISRKTRSSWLKVRQDLILRIPRLTYAGELVLKPTGHHPKPMFVKFMSLRLISIKLHCRSTRNGQGYRCWFTLSKTMNWQRIPFLPDGWGGDFYLICVYSIRRKVPAMTFSPMALHEIAQMFIARCSPDKQVEITICHIFVTKYSYFSYKYILVWGKE